MNNFHMLVYGDITGAVNYILLVSIKWNLVELYE